MPVIHIHLASGRPPEARRALLSAVSAAVGDTLDLGTDQIRVLIHEVPPEHFLAGAETLAERAADRTDLT